MPGELSNTGFYFMGNKVFEESDLLPPELLNKTAPLVHGQARLKPLPQYAAQTQRTEVASYSTGVFPLPPHRMPFNQLMAGRDYDNARPGSSAQQAWASGPTFRFFKRAQYFPRDYGSQTQRDRRTGDSFYRPRSIADERGRAGRIFRNVQMKPVRLGEW